MLGFLRGIFSKEEGRLKQENATLISKNKELESKILELEQESDSSEKLVEDYKIKINTLELNITSFEQDNKDLIAKLQIAEKEKIDAVKISETSSLESSSLKLDFETLRTENKSLNEKIELQKQELTSINEALKKENNELKDKIDALEAKSEYYEKLLAKKPEIKLTDSSTKAPAKHKLIPKRDKKLILIVDDSIVVRNFQKQILESNGFQVHLATDGMDGQENVKKLLPDVVISDIEMPRMNGIELSKWLKNQYDEIPVVLITSHNYNQDKDLIEEAQADDFIIKKELDEAKLLSVLAKFT